MKKVLLYFFFFFYLLNIHAQTKPTYVYYTPVNMPPALKTNYYGQFDTKLLAEDLCILLSKATGTNFIPAVYIPGKQTGIFLQLDTQRITGNEEGIIEGDGKTFVKITSRYTTGISYAMYSWLEELGFHFYLPGDEWTIIPTLSAIFNKPINKIYRPYFHIRMFGASGGIFPVKGLDEKKQNEKDWMQWYQRNRMGCDYIRIEGHIGELFNITHRKEIENDSLIVAPVNGKRLYSTGSKLDPTYEKGVALFSNWIAEQFRIEQLGMPGFLPFKKYYTVDAGDGYDYCHTPACESRFKSVSDQVFSIANETARKIKLADPRAGVSTLAYTERADTPTIRILPNVHIMVVAGAFQTAGTAAGLMQRWSRKSSNISLYDYLNIGVWSYDKPFFNLQQYHYFLEFLKQIKIEGINFETSYSKFGSGILQYFILKYLCDPYSSTDDVLDEFCKNNFGKAAPSIKQLLKEWYFSDVHLQTNADYPSFYEDELGRFIKYLVDADNTPGLSVAVRKRIGELKAYTVYLCKYYELFCELKGLQAFATNPGLRNEKAEALLTYTWQLYSTKIFHNTQLNDMLKKMLPGEEQEKWNYNSSDHYSKIANSVPLDINIEFEKVKKKYIPMATVLYTLSDSFFDANTRYSADSFRISTSDERALVNFNYPLQFFCSGPGTVRVFYQTDSSQIKKNKKEKVALIAIESEDYNYIKSENIYKENSQGMVNFNIPERGYYRLYLSQFNATHMDYTVYPGSNLFYHNKKSPLAGGLIMQGKNDYLAIYAPPVDSIHFSNVYYSSSNTSQFFSADGNSIDVKQTPKSFYYAIAVPVSQKQPFIFFRNSLYRWPPVLKNTAPYYFFLKYPLQ